MSNNTRILRLAKVADKANKELRDEVEIIAAGILPATCFDPRDMWHGWNFAVLDGKLQVWQITYDDRGPSRTSNRQTFDLKAAIAIEEDRDTYCGVCGSKYISQTKGIPSYRRCPNGHKWERGKR